MGSLPIGISGSRAAAILGMSPWATPFSVWQDIMEKRQPGFNAAHKYDYEAFEGNASTRWGLAFEDAIIKLAEGKAGEKIDNREKEYKHKDFDYVTCHIDGNYHPYTPIDRHKLHEGKTTTAFGFSDKWGEPGTDKIPVEYQTQVQHQMLCTGADECIVSVLVFPKRPDDWEAEGWYITDDQTEGFTVIRNDNIKEIGEPETLIDGDDVQLKRQLMRAPWYNTRFMSMALDMMGYFHQYTVPANRDLQQLMLDKYRVWWTKYVLGETPPEPADYSDIRAMITEPVGTIIVDDDTARWFKEYKSIGSEIGSGGNLAKRRDQLKVLILTNARALEATLDDESTDKWIFRDDKGDKLGSYGRTKKGAMVFR